LIGFYGSQSRPECTSIPHADAACWWIGPAAERFTRWCRIRPSSPALAATFTDSLIVAAKLGTITLPGINTTLPDGSPTITFGVGFRKSTGGSNHRRKRPQSGLQQEQRLLLSRSERPRGCFLGPTVFDWQECLDDFRNRGCRAAAARSHCKVGVVALQSRAHCRGAAGRLLSHFTTKVKFSRRR
jgi:hypothetical protein